jgi:hypothetical protein
MLKEALQQETTLQQLYFKFKKRKSRATLKAEVKKLGLFDYLVESDKWGFSEKMTLKLREMVNGNCKLKEMVTEFQLPANLVNNKMRALGLCTPTGLKMSENRKLKKEGKKRCINCNQIKDRERFKKIPYFYFVCDSCFTLLSTTPSLKLIKAVLKSRLRGATERGEKFDREVSVGVADLVAQWEQQKGLCYYSKIPMALYHDNEKVVSLDRIDSSKGYVKNNIVLCCHRVNSMKSNLTLEEFKFWCTAVSDTDI